MVRGTMKPQPVIGVTVTTRVTHSYHASRAWVWVWRGCTGKPVVWLLELPARRLHHKKS